MGELSACNISEPPVCSLHPRNFWKQLFRLIFDKFVLIAFRMKPNSKQRNYKSGITLSLNRKALGKKRKREMEEGVWAGRTEKAVEEDVEVIMSEEKGMKMRIWKIDKRCLIQRRVVERKKRAGKWRDGPASPAGPPVINHLTPVQKSSSERTSDTSRRCSHHNKKR